MSEPDSDTLESVRLAARPAAQDSQARRPRPGLGQGPLLRPRDQGPEVARRLAPDARGIRGRPDAARDAPPEAARQHLARRDADRPVPHLLPAGEPPRPRPLRGRGGGHARDAEGEGPDPLDPQGREAPRRRRAHEEALDHGAWRLGDGPREGRGRRRHPDAPQGAEGEEGAEAPHGSCRRARARGSARRPQPPSPRPLPTNPRARVRPAFLARQRLAGSGAPAPGAVHGRDPGRLPPWLVDSRRRASTPRRSPGSSGAACSACSASSAAARSRGSRSSRSGSCRTSRRRSCSSFSRSPCRGSSSSSARASRATRRSPSTPATAPSASRRRRRPGTPTCSTAPAVSSSTPAGSC